MILDKNKVHYDMCISIYHKNVNFLDSVICKMAKNLSDVQGIRKRLSVFSEAKVQHKVDNDVLKT